MSNVILSPTKVQEQRRRLAELDARDEASRRRLDKENDAAEDDLIRAVSDGQNIMVWGIMVAFVMVFVFTIAGGA